MNSIFSRNACLLACVLSAAIWLLALTTAQDSVSTSASDLVVPPSESVTTLHGPADVDDATPVQDAAPANRPAVAKRAVDADAVQPGVRFESIDVFVNSGRQALAAYQFELASETPGVEIVGIEGGAHAAFQKAPYYDPRAMQQNRVIVAAFSTAAELPTGISRVARIHVQLQGLGPKTYRTRLSVSADRDGNTIPSAVSVARAVAP